MSPEQIRGERLDPRTDLFSFGIVLYEMATGTLPFRGDTTGLVLDGILNRMPAAPARFNSALPDRLQDILCKALEKEHDLRYQSAAEMRRDFQDLKRETESGGRQTSPQAQFVPNERGQPSFNSCRDCHAIILDSGTRRAMQMAHVLFTDIVGVFPSADGSAKAGIAPFARSSAGHSRICSGTSPRSTYLAAHGRRHGPCISWRCRGSGPLCSRIVQGPSAMAGYALANGYSFRPGVSGAGHQRGTQRSRQRHQYRATGDGLRGCWAHPDFKAVADMLDQVSTWKTALHDLGEAEVKHGVRVHLYNLYTDEAGNRELPQKLRTAQTTAERRGLYRPAAMGAVVLVLVLAGFFLIRRSKGKELTASPGVKQRRSVAVLGFKNLAGKPDEAWLSTAISEMLTTNLAAGEELRLVPGETVSQMKNSLALADAESYAPETLDKIRRQTNADDVVIGSYLALGSANEGKVQLDLKLQGAQAGETIVAFSEEGKETELMDLVSRAGARLREKLGAGDIAPNDLAGRQSGVPCHHRRHPVLLGGTRQAASVRQSKCPGPAPKGRSRRPQLRSGSCRSFRSLEWYWSSRSRPGRSQTGVRPVGQALKGGSPVDRGSLSRNHS